MIIEIKGRIGADGTIVLKTGTVLPPGDVDIVIAYTDKHELRR